MRAAKLNRNARGREIHISGAEGICSDKERPKIVEGYIERALTHPRGEPDTIVISIERITQKPKTIPALPVTTLACDSPAEAMEYINQILSTIRISKTAIKNGLKVLSADNPMRGASVIRSHSGRRVEPDRERGVRASRLGITKAAEKVLFLRLKKEGINNTTVKEALILASKVVSCRHVAAELCISDDPDYTTGYIASKSLGYIRVPNIKMRGRKTGGRVFFVHEHADVNSVVEFMEKTAVMINKASIIYGIKSADEILDRHNI